GPVLPPGLLEWLRAAGAQEPVAARPGGPACGVVRDRDEHGASNRLRAGQVYRGAEALVRCCSENPPHTREGVSNTGVPVPRHWIPLGSARACRSMTRPARPRWGTYWGI